MKIMSRVTRPLLPVMVGLSCLSCSHGGMVSPTPTLAAHDAAPIKDGAWLFIMSHEDTEATPIVMWRTEAGYEILKDWDAESGQFIPLTNPYPEAPEDASFLMNVIRFTKIPGFSGLGWLAQYSDYTVDDLGAVQAEFHYGVMVMKGDDAILYRMECATRDGVIRLGPKDAIQPPVSDFHDRLTPNPNGCGIAAGMDNLEEAVRYYVENDLFLVNGQPQYSSFHYCGSMDWARDAMREEENGGVSFVENCRAARGL